MAAPAYAAEANSQQIGRNSYKENLSRLRENHPEIQQGWGITEVQKRILLEKAVQPEESVRVPTPSRVPEIIPLEETFSESEKKLTTDKSWFSAEHWQVHLPEESRRTPYEIIEAARQKHRGSAESVSMKERFQQIKEQIPQRSSQLQESARQLPIQAREQTGMQARELAVRMKPGEDSAIQRLVRSVQYRTDSIKQRIRAAMMTVLEQTSDRATQAAQQLKP